MFSALLSIVLVTYWVDVQIKALIIVFLLLATTLPRRGHAHQDAGIADPDNMGKYRSEAS